MTMTMTMTTTMLYHFHCCCRHLWTHHVRRLSCLCTWILLSLSYSSKPKPSLARAFYTGGATRWHDADNVAAVFHYRCNNDKNIFTARITTAAQTRFILDAFNSNKKRGWQHSQEDDHDGHYDHYDNDNDDNDHDNEPPSISTSPQEFLYRLQQRQQQSIISNDNDTVSQLPISASLPGGSDDFQLPNKSKKNNHGRNNNNQRIENSNILRIRKGDSASASTVKAIYTCTNCQSEYVQWVGKCSGCHEYNTIVQEFRSKASPSRSGNLVKDRSMFEKSSWLDGVSRGIGYGSSRDWDVRGSGPVRVTDIYQAMLDEGTSSSSPAWLEAYNNGSLKEQRTRIPNDPELNAVLGGGLMPGSITLVGGDPGVGKSTLLLQMAGSVASMAERSLQYQGVGMGPPLPSPTMVGTSKESFFAKKNSGTREESSVNNDDAFARESPTWDMDVGGGGYGPVIYISGEENANQIASRALRLGIQDPELLLWCETDADAIASTVVNSMYYNDDDDVALSTVATGNDGNRSSRGGTTSPKLLSRPPSLIVVDSIQTMVCDAAGASSVGGITQVRECVGLFLRLAKSTGIPIMLVGHVTKSGDVAGPRTVEHMVDCVLYLEGGALLGTGGGGSGGFGAGAVERSGDGGGGVSSLRVLRAAKNRFGSSEEVGVYEMGRAGRLIPISDPSSFFLSTRQDNTDAEGCAISVVLEGIRSMAVEVQALVAWSAGSAGYSGRRIVDGISNSRLQLILAVLHKRYGLSFRGRDVYVNVVGGMHLGRGSKSGGGSDLAVAVSIVSSLAGIPVRSDTAFVGEIGLLGELRPVHSLDKRISEARRMGFSRIVTPAPSNQKKNRGGTMYPGPKEVSASGIKQLLCDNLWDAINCGLVSKIPAKQNKTGMTSKKSLRSIPDVQTRSYDLMNDMELIEDNEDDDYNFE